MPPILIIGALILLLVLAVPVFISLLLPTIAGLLTSGLGLPPISIVQRAVQGVNIAPLLAIPLFVFAADVISRGEIGERLVAVADAFVGHIPGGLAIATAVTMAIFGAISGIGMAAIVSIGPIVYPAMLAQGYGRRFTVGLILAGSTLAMLVPPSVAVILYCLQTSQSIAKVFLSASGAGIVFLLLIVVYSYAYGVRRRIAAGRKFHATNAIRALSRSGWALGLPAIILGGIYTGFFTVTEAAAVSAVYALAVEIVIYRALDWRRCLQVSSESGGTISMLLILIAAGSVLAWLMTVQQVPQMIVQFTGNSGANVTYMLINAVFLVAGMFIDPNSAIIVLAPLIYPAAVAAQIDPVHLGAVITLNLAIGMISPPFGINLFVGMVTFKTTFMDVIRGSFPFLILGLIALVIVTYVPSSVMWLVGLSSIH